MSTFGKVFYVLTCVGLFVASSVGGYFAYRSADWIDLIFCAAIAAMAALALIYFEPSKNKQGFGWFDGGGDC